MRTNIGGKFISLLNKHFPSNSPLHTLFNTKNIKVSYKTTKNMSAIVNNHNRRILSNSQEVHNRPGCNCRDGKDACPLRGKCLDKEMIYKAEVKQAKGRPVIMGRQQELLRRGFMVMSVTSATGQKQTPPHSLDFFGGSETMEKIRRSLGQK